jgi:cysteine-rich repeat protein
MRTLLLASLALIPACLIGEGDITGNDNKQPGVCGDGVINTGESCDDGNTASGDGCSATCQTETSSPHAALSVSMGTVATDLNVETSITVTATSVMGFAGDVPLTLTVADAASAPIADWTTTLDSQTLTLAADGTATATLKISAMGDTAALAGTVKVSSTVASADASVGVTFNPILHIVFSDNGGLCDYPIGHSIQSPYKIKTGRQIAIYNASATLGMVVHTGGQIQGFPHEAQVAPGTTPGTAYMKTITDTTDGNEDTFYCHVGVTNTMGDSLSNNTNLYSALKVVL